MNQLQHLKDSLLEKYNVDCDRFIELYEQGFSREEMEVELSCTSFKLRMIAAALNLRWVQKHRVNDIQLLMTRDTEVGPALQAEELTKLKENVAEYERELTVREKALVRTRREANRLRAQMREESIEDAILEVIAEATAKVTPLAPIVTDEVVEDDGIDFVLFSDWHIGATVKLTDVPDNTFSWEVAQQRIHQLMTQVVLQRSTSSLHIYLLGDMLDGLIHDSLQASDMNPAQAAKELAHLLGGYISALREIYPAVSVYCLNGNHSRLTDKISSVSKGFDFEFLCYSILEALTVNVIDHFEISTVGMIAAEVSPGVFAGLHHGDNFRGATNSASRDLQILERFRQMGPDVSHLLQGHSHIFESHVLPTGGFAICNGSLIGTNGYVHTNGFIPVSSVQVIGTWGSDGQLAKVVPIAV